MKDVPLGDVNDDHFILQNLGFEITLGHDRLTYSHRKKLRHQRAGAGDLPKIKGNLSR
jgi:hypothetical protein